MAFESLRSLPEFTQMSKLRNAQLLHLRLRTSTPLLSTNNFDVVSIAPTGQFIATAGRRFEVELWGVDGQLRRPLEGIKANVLCIACSPDGQELAAGLTDGSVAVWNIDQTELPQRLAGHLSRVTSIAYFGHALITGSHDCTVRIWEKPYCSSQDLITHKSYVRSIAVGTSLLISSACDGCIVVYDLVQRVLIQEWKHPNARVYAVAVAPDGKTVASGGTGQTIALWTVRENALHENLTGHRGAVNALAFSADGQYLFSGGDDGYFCIWAMETKTQIKKVEEVNIPITGIAVCDNLVLYGNHKPSCHLWKIEDLLEAAEPERGWLLALSVSPCGHYIATGGEDGTVFLWDSTLKWRNFVCRHNAFIQHVQFCGENIISLSEDGHLTIYSIPAQTLRELTVAPRRRFGCSPNGQYLAAIIQQRSVAVIELSTLERVQTIKANTEGGYVLFAPCGTKLLYSVWAGKLALTDLSNQHQLAEFNIRAKVTSVAFSPCGRYLAVSGINRLISLFSTATGENVSGEFCPPVVISGFYGQCAAWRQVDEIVSSLAYSPDGKYLAYACHHKEIVIVCLETNTSVQLTGHSDIVTCIDFSTSSEFLVSVSRDSTVKIWTIRKAIKHLLPQQLAAY